jgi:hypothetical protein
MSLGIATAIAPAAHAATNVVTCTPTAGLKTTATVKPPMVNNVSPDAALGIALSATLDGCTANAAQLAAWVPSKLGGTANGAMIAKVAISLKTKAFGTCNFAAPDAGAYPASGTLSLKWLDAGSKTVAKTTPTSAYVRVSGNLATVSADADGIATKGVGIGSNVHTSVGFDLASPINAPVLACNTGPYSGPSITQIALITTASSVVSLDFP